MITNNLLKILKVNF